jgi:hypothetical protein
MVRFTIVLIIGLLFFQASCKKSPTEPEFKNPREYTWTATMLSYPGSGQTSMYSIWASNPTDVYVCGFSSLGGTKGAMYHFNGKGWQPVGLPSGGYVWDYNYFWETTGFAANNIWVAGWRWYADPSNPSRLVDSAAVLHYDGAGWKQMLPSHMGVRGLKSIWGSSSQNLFFASRDGKVIHFDGTKWNVDTLHLGLSIRDLGGDETQVFGVGNTWNGVLNDSIMCFLRTSDGWRLIDLQLLTEHTSVPRFGSSAVYSPASGIYYSCGYLGVFRWEANRWMRVFSPVASPIGMGGSSSTNILAVGWRDGPVIYHWDGASWDEIKLLEGLIPANVELYGVWTNGREAFIVGNNGAVTYVLHGK